MLNPQQLRLFVIRPAIKHIGLWSLSAENLVLGTAITESSLSELDQGGDLSPGPAFGLWQMERATYVDIWENFLVYQLELSKLVRGLTPWQAAIPPIEELYGNLFFASAMARVHYRRVAAPLPKSDDYLEMAKYWKQHYNTPKGKGSADDPRVLKAFKRACL
jgi:hypothetical protein